MKFLDTFETWHKIFKLTRNENYFVLYVHDISKKSYDTIQFSEKELKGLASFINRFLDSK